MALIHEVVEETRDGARDPLSCQVIVQGGQCGRYVVEKETMYPADRRATKDREPSEECYENNERESADCPPNGFDELHRRFIVDEF